jgi:beta-lactam-binding protein with PASTA domain
MKKVLLISLLTITITGCTEFAILMSGSSLAISQNTYAKVYNAADMLTIMGTKKGIKRHAYDSAKKALEGAKKGKKYIYDKTWGLTD